MKSWTLKNIKSCNHYMYIYNLRIPLKLYSCGFFSNLYLFIWNWYHFFFFFPTEYYFLYFYSGISIVITICPWKHTLIGNSIYALCNLWLSGFKEILKLLYKLQIFECKVLRFFFFFFLSRCYYFNLRYFFLNLAFYKLMVYLMLNTVKDFCSHPND